MRLLIFLFALQFLNSCSSTEDTGKPSEVEALFKSAKEDMEDARYLAAIEKLKQVKDEHPYSKLAVLANLELANVYFLQEEYSSAYAQYSVFRDLYPKHPEIEYVMYRQGESLYKGLPATIDRDLSDSPKAMKHYQELLDKFPNGKYSKDAKEGIEKSRNKLLEKEDYIGHFYYKRDYWPQAFARYKGLREQFPGSRLDDKALYRMIVSLQKQNLDASSYIEEIKRLHPNSSYTKDVTN